MTVVSVALGYHWLSDLIAGGLVGLGVALVVGGLDWQRMRSVPPLSPAARRP
ncbi:MAG: hypothetical protein ACFCVK_04225 [Acidimicrobiales bacterium]